MAKREPIWIIVLRRDPDQFRKEFAVCVDVDGDECYVGNTYKTPKAAVKAAMDYLDSHCNREIVVTEGVCSW